MVMNSREEDHASRLGSNHKVNFGSSHKKQGTPRIARNGDDPFRASAAPVACLVGPDKRKAP
jgi:hypothetical protein